MLNSVSMINQHHKIFTKEKYYYTYALLPLVKKKVLIFHIKLHWYEYIWNEIRINLLQTTFSFSYSLCCHVRNSSYHLTWSLVWIVEVTPKFKCLKTLLKINHELRKSNNTSRYDLKTVIQKKKIRTQSS